LISESAASTNLGSWGGAADLWGLLTLCSLFHTGATVFKANSCEKFEAKMSEKSEKKGSEFLK
jgi:hypothetical protein